MDGKNVIILPIHLAFATSTSSFANFRACISTIKPCTIQDINKARPVRINTTWLIIVVVTAWVRVIFILRGIVQAVEGLGTI